MAGFYAAVDNPADYVDRQKFYRIIRPEPRRHPALDGLTIKEHAEKIASEIVHSTPPDIHESFRLDHSYRYGIGLEIIVDSPIVDQTVIERCIRRVQKLGETDRQSPDLIPRDHLPFQTQAEALASVALHER